MLSCAEFRLQTVIEAALEIAGLHAAQKRLQVAYHLAPGGGRLLLLLCEAGGGGVVLMVVLLPLPVMRVLLRSWLGVNCGSCARPTPLLPQCTRL